jgi:hypothetical protein
MNINNEQKAILKHANNNNGLYCGGSQTMDSLCKLDLMEYAGKKTFVPDPYYKITGKGKNILNEEHHSKNY